MLNKIKSIDFKMKAKGFGVVNWNGPTSLKGKDGSSYDNHTLPKLRGYTPLTGNVSDKGYNYRKEPVDIDFTKNPMYVSQNCFRHHLFKNHAFDLNYAESKHAPQIIASITGLIRGYVIPNISFKRTSPLLLEDLVDQLGNGNFEQLGKSGGKNSNSIFSKTTFGETYFLGYGSINVEDVQFISLDPKFDNAAMIVDEVSGVAVAELIVAYLKSLDDTKNPQAVYHANYVRKGTILHIGQAGILLNDDAISILVQETLKMIANLTIRQGKGYLVMDEVLVDYNTSSKMMRIKNDESSINEVEGEYAVYYVAE